MNMQPTQLDAYKLIHDGTLALARAEQAGMRIDVEYCERKKTHLTRKIARIEDNLSKTELVKQWKKINRQNFNMDSNDQLGKILYDVMRIKPPKQTKSGKGSTDEDTLSQIDLPELKDILRIRKLRKVRDTYLDAFVREQVNGWLHPFFHLHTVKTFRSSSSDPNFQNIPKRDKEAMNICRRAIFPREGHQILAIDFSGVEVRVACCYTEDPKLIYDTIHGDMHRDMAIEIYMLDGLDKHHDGENNFRQGGKNGWVFPQFYGDYYLTCAANLLEWAGRSYRKDGTPGLVHLSDRGLLSLDSAGHIKNDSKFVAHCKKVEDDFWNVRYKVYTKWKEATWQTYQKKGYINLKTGFRYSGVARKNELLNAPIQGSAFHCLLWSFIQVDRIQQEENWDTRLFSQIHDEMLTDTHPDELKHVAKTVQKVTCEDLAKEWPWVIVPMEVGADLSPVDGSWNMKESYKLPEVK